MRTLAFAVRSYAPSEFENIDLNNVRRTGNSSLPRLCCRFGLQRGRARDTAHSFFSRFESPLARAGGPDVHRFQRAQQMTLPVWIGRALMIAFGRFRMAHLFVVAGKTLSTTRERQNRDGGVQKNEPTHC